MSVSPMIASGAGRFVLGIAGAIAALALLEAGLLCWKAYRFERRLMFESHPLGRASPVTSGLEGAQNVEYGLIEGGALRGWYLPSRNGAAIVFVHGVGGDRRSLAREAALLRGAGYGALLIDLPGQGESGGRITCGRAEEAAVGAAVDWLARQGVRRIGGLSFSLGSEYLARVAAADRRLEAVVLEAASTSIVDRIRATQGRWAWLTTPAALAAFLQEGVDPRRDQAIDAVSAIAPRPLLLIGGAKDPMATPAMGQALAARAGSTARVETFDTGHGGYWEADRERYSRLLLSFFASALPG